MKKIVIAFMLIIGLAACGGSKETAKPQVVPSSAPQVVTTVPAGQATRDKPPLPAQAENGRPKGVERDISKPNETVDYVIWRNGKMHKVKLKLKRTEVLQDDGKRVEVVDADVSDLESQLPPIDHSKDKDVPSPEEIRQAYEAVGVNPDGPSTAPPPNAPPSP